MDDGDGRNSYEKSVSSRSRPRRQVRTYHKSKSNIELNEKSVIRRNEQTGAAVAAPTDSGLPREWLYYRVLGGTEEIYWLPPRYALLFSPSKTPAIQPSVKTFLPIADRLGFTPFIHIRTYLRLDEE